MILLLNKYIDDQMDIIITNCRNPFSTGYIFIYLAIFVNLWRMYKCQKLK